MGLGALRASGEERVRLCSMQIRLNTLLMSLDDGTSQFHTSKDVRGRTAARWLLTRIFFCFVTKVTSSQFQCMGGGGTFTAKLKEKWYRLIYLWCSNIQGVW